MKNLSFNLYKYIKKRSLNTSFKNYENKNYEIKLNTIELNLYKYIYNRSNIKEKVDFKTEESFPFHIKLNSLFEENNIEGIMNLLNYQNISNDINHITNNSLNDNIILNDYISIITNIIEDIKQLDPSKHYLNNKNDTIINIFKNFITKEENNYINFIVLFKQNKIEIERKLKKLKEYKNKLLDIQKKFFLNIKNLNNYLSNLTNINNIINKFQNKTLEILNKEKEILELISVIKMSIKTLEINLENINNQLNFSNKLEYTTNNLFNIGMLLFLNNKYKDFNDIIIKDEENYKLYLQELDNIIKN